MNRYRGFGRWGWCVIGAVVAATGCQALRDSGLLAGLEKPRVQAVRPRIAGLNFEGVDLEFDLDVLNPYNVTIPSPRIEYALDVAERPFLATRSVEAQSLPARQVGTVTLPVRLQYADLWNTLTQLRDARELPYTLRGKLIATALGQPLELPMEQSGTVPVVRPPTFSQYEVREPEVSLSSARIAMNMAVENPNIFRVGLDGLGYTLRLGEIEVGSVRAESPAALEPGASGTVSLTGTVSGLSVVRRLLEGGALGLPEVLPSGSIQTPYGALRLPSQ